MKKTTPIALIAVLMINLTSCRHNSKNTSEVVQLPEPKEEIVMSREDSIQMEELKQHEKKIKANLSNIIISIIAGNCDSLAMVTDFPIWRPYPEKDIENAEEFKNMFHILFDDSIRHILKQFTAEDWVKFSWHGYMFNNGKYFWASEEGRLNYINYESTKLRTYRKKLSRDEYQALGEDKRWSTIDCLLASDSAVFLRLEEWDGIQRLHVFTHDANEYKKHMIFHGTMETQGSCSNDVYWYACCDGLITVWINSPSCLNSEIDFGVEFPNIFYLPEYLQGKTFRCKRTQWREVKKWW